jgi:methionine synthase / methylenetetrahydrofolate reductase(NADPH)
MTADFLDFISNDVVLCDGAMGTRLYDGGVFLNRCFDEINLTDPDMAKAVHVEYLRAGARLIQTNTFGGNIFKLGKYHLEEKCVDINRRGAEIAREALESMRDAAGENAWVAGSIGPLGIRIEPWGRVSLAEATDAFREQAKALLDGGVDLFILETFGDVSEIRQAIVAVRSITDKPIVAQMTITGEGRSLYGTEPEIFSEHLERWGADVIGLNCSVGPHHMLATLETMAAHTSLPLSVQPNAGNARNVEGRVFYLSSPDYFAKYAHRFIRAGVRLIGGCCGTTPEHIKAMASVVRMKQHSRRESTRRQCAFTPDTEVETIPMEKKSALGGKIAAGEFIFSVELTPPKGWDMTKVLGKARKAREAGFDSVNIPDGPRASARVGVLATTLRIKREAEIDPIIHYVCRDRNLLGMQSDLLGAYSLGMANFLLLTGDPPVMGDYPKSTPVFDVDSIGLTNLAASLNRGVDLGNRSIGKPTGFLIGVGVNPTAVNVELEVERFYWKVDAGAEYAISQPVFDPAALLEFIDRSAAYMKKEGIEPVPVVAGVWPLQSLKNAEFLLHEVPGVTIPDEVMERMRQAGSAEKEKEVGMEVAREQIAEILPHVQGLQVSTPFGRIKPAVSLMKYTRKILAE